MKTVTVTDDEEQIWMKFFCLVKKKEMDEVFACDDVTKIRTARKKNKIKMRHS